MRPIYFFSVFLLLSLSLIKAQEVHVSYKEEVFLDIAPCEDCGREPCPDGSEALMLSDDVPVCASSSPAASVEKKRSLAGDASADDLPDISVTDSMVLDVAVLIRVGLNVPTYYNFSRLPELLTKERGGDFQVSDYSFQEYFALHSMEPDHGYSEIGLQTLENITFADDRLHALSLDVGVLIDLDSKSSTPDIRPGMFTNKSGDFEAMPYSFQEYVALRIVSDHLSISRAQCPRGFEVEWLPVEDGILEFTVCSFRWTHELLRLMQPSTFFDISLAPKPDFGSLILTEGTRESHPGQQHFLINQEFLISIPCFPGTFCSGGKLLMVPKHCPVGTYASMHGQAGCDPCPFDFTTSSTGSLSFEECRDGTRAVEKSVLTSDLFDIRPTNQTFETLADLLEAQTALKDGLFQWIVALTASSNENETRRHDTKIDFHILKWEIEL
jgi:hypothetical protein